MLTRIGFHTFAMMFMLTFDEAEDLLGDFLRYCNRSDNLKIYPDCRFRTIDINKSPVPTIWNTKYLRNDLGVMWILRFLTPVPSHRNCMIEARINPQILFGNDDYVAISGESDLPAIEKAYNIFAAKISSNMPSFAKHTLNHVDYCGNFDLVEMGYDCSVKQMLKLMKQAFIPFHYKVDETYDPISKRMMPYRNGLYAKSRSATINNYGKQAQLYEKFAHRTNDILRAENLIRYEIQCYSSKIRKFKEEIIRSMNPWEKCDYAVTKRLLSDEIAKAVLSNYFRRTIIHGDYYTLEKAKDKVEFLGYRQQRRDRLFLALDLVDEHGGIEAVKKYFQTHGGQFELFIESAKELADLGISPVTTPRRVGCMPNLMNGYNLMFGD